MRGCVAFLHVDCDGGGDDSMETLDTVELVRATEEMLEAQLEAQVTGVMFEAAITQSDGRIRCEPAVLSRAVTLAGLADPARVQATCPSRSRSPRPRPF